MEQLQDQSNEEEVVDFIPEGATLAEEILRKIILGYQEAWNKNNDKFEINYQLTITTHKITTEAGNKNVAYLRLERGIRPKGGSDEDWERIIVHQEVYFFRNTQERLNPKKPYVEQLYINALARLTGAGLEYAELLKRMKRPKLDQDETPKTEEQQNEERLNKIGLVSAKEVPMALNKSDEEYKQWLAAERAKEGL